MFYEFCKLVMVFEATSLLKHKRLLLSKNAVILDFRKNYGNIGVRVLAEKFHTRKHRPHVLFNYMYVIIYQMKKKYIKHGLKIEMTTVN